MTTPHDNLDNGPDDDATSEQLAELRRLGISEKELQGLTFSDAEEWIDELRTERVDADRFDPQKPII